MHGKKQACEKNTSSKVVVQAPHQKNPSNLPQPSFFLPYLHLVGGVPLLVNFFATLLLFFPLCETYLAVLYCTVVIDPILTVKKCGSSVFLFLLFFSTSIALYCIPLRCIASRPGNTMSSTRSSSVQPQRDRPLHELLSRDMVYVPFSERASLSSSRATD